jgi:hypothetical protein
MNIAPETNYTVDENQRNRDNAELFTEMLKVAFPGRNIHVMSSHHICFMLDCNFHTIDEIPSADALMFDHAIMGRVFGKNRAIRLMSYLATLPPGQKRDSALKREFNVRQLRNEGSLPVTEWPTLQSLDT